MAITLSFGTDITGERRAAGESIRVISMREAYVNSVLEIVSLIPSGRVLAYGDVAELLGAGGPRQVGYVMSHYGGAVPWWRVLRAGGEPPPCHDSQAMDYYRNEETPLHPGRGSGSAGRVDMPAARWRPTESEWAAVETIAGKLSQPHDEVVP